MKKVILILGIATLFFSCEKETPTCNCSVVEQKSYGNGWIDNRVIAPYGTNCDENNKIIVNSHYGIDGQTQYRQIVKCK